MTTQRWRSPQIGRVRVSVVAHVDGGQGQGPASMTSIETEFGFRLGQTHRVLRETWERQISDLGLSGPLALMLRAICEQPGSGLRELARRMRTDPMNAKRLVDHLERDGLVRSRGAASHTRRRELSPTAAGLTLAAGVVERSLTWRRRLEQILGDGELMRLQHLLVRLEDALVDGPARDRPRGGPTETNDVAPGTPSPQLEGGQA